MLSSSKDVLIIFLWAVTDAMYYWFNVATGLFFNIPLPGVSGKESFLVGDLQHLGYLGFLPPVSRVTSEIKLVDSFVVFWEIN